MIPAGLVATGAPDVKPIVPGVRTMAGVALLEVFRDADATVAADVVSGVLHKGTALATLYAFREAVRPFNASLADELIAHATEKAEVQA